MCRSWCTPLPPNVTPYAPSVSAPRRRTSAANWRKPRGMVILEGLLADLRLFAVVLCIPAGVLA